MLQEIHFAVEGAVIVAGAVWWLWQRGERKGQDAKSVDSLTSTVDDLKEDMVAVKSKLTTVGEAVARIEGILSGHSHR